MTAAVLIAAWQALVWATGVPRFILPDPARVAVALWERAGLIGYHALFTMGEILGGLALGVVLGAATALTLSYFRPARRWLMPVLVFSQAIPVFALAPLLVLWLGYGMASKVAMATLIIYFPVTSAFFDGLRRTEPGWLDLARTMGGSRWTTLVGSACRQHCPPSPPACGSPRRWRRSAPWSASGSGPRPGSDT